MEDVTNFVYERITKFLLGKNYNYESRGGFFYVNINKRTGKSNSTGK